MKKLILVGVLALAVGYAYGYGDSQAGRPQIGARILNSFGMSKMKDAQNARERRVQDIIKD